VFFLVHLRSLLSAGGGGGGFTFGCLFVGCWGGGGCVVWGGGFYVWSSVVSFLSCRVLCGVVLVVMFVLKSCYYSYQAAVAGMGDLWQVLAIDLYIDPYRCRRTI